MSTNVKEKRAGALAAVREQLNAATAARKCHGCGCFHKTVEALASTAAGRGELAPALEQARAAFTPKEYDCLGCPVCYPAIASNAFSEAFAEEADAFDLCPTEAPPERRGWPPLMGDYKVLRYRAPVAVCTLNSAGLAERLAEKQPEGVAIVGTLQTENLGIERIIRNILANPHIRFVVLSGDDTEQAVGHLPGQSLVSLLVGGVDDRGRIIGARGKRPVLKNVRRDQIDAFRRQVEVADLIGVNRESVILDHVLQCAARDPGAFSGTPEDSAVEVVVAQEPRHMIPDPAGFFVLYPDAPRRCVIVEHYTNAGVLDCVLEDASPTALYATAIERKLVTRLDHAAYLGRELARAQRAMETGEPYVQDRAPGKVLEPEPAVVTCGCEAECASEKVDEQ